MHIPALKTATQKAVKICGGPEYAKDITRVGKSQLSDYGNRNSPQMVPVDVAVDLDLSAQQPLILTAMANAEGYRLVPMHFGEGHIPRDLGKFAETTSDVLQAGLDSLADGKVDVNEALAVLKHMQAVAITAAHIEAAMRKIVDENKPQIIFPPQNSGAA